MATRSFILLSSGDREVAMEVALVYPLNAVRKGWMDEVRVILFGPSERVSAEDTEVQGKLRELQDNGINVIACKACADRLGVTEKLEALGLEVVYVGPIISQLVKDGWAALTF